MSTNNPSNNPLMGVGYLLKGFKLVLRPGLRRYVVVPVLINTLLFSAVIYFGANLVFEFSQGLLPDWLDFLAFILVPLFLLLSAVAMFFTFTMVANLIASPFNGLLAEAVEYRLTGRELPPLNTGKLLREAGMAIVSELKKLGYILIRIVPLLLLFFIPVIGPLMWAAFSAWMLAISYIDYPLANHGLAFPEQRTLIGERRWLGLGFGVAVMATMAIPVVNFIVMPCAVAGATALCLDNFATNMPSDQSLSVPE